MKNVAKSAKQTRGENWSRFGETGGKAKAKTVRHPKAKARKAQEEVHENWCRESGGGKSVQQTRSELERAPNNLTLTLVPKQTGPANLHNVNLNSETLVLDSCHVGVCVKGVCHASDTTHLSFDGPSYRLLG